MECLHFGDQHVAFLTVQFEKELQQFLKSLARRLAQMGTLLPIAIGSSVLNASSFGSQHLLRSQLDQARRNVALLRPADCIEPSCLGLFSR